MPENPYTANPYAAWPISGFPTRNKAKEIKRLATILCCNEYLIDWRAGHSYPTPGLNLIGEVSFYLKRK